MAARIFMRSPLLLLMLPFALGIASDVSISNLRCEFLRNPIGLDNVRPRFSWEISSDGRGIKQLSYQLTIGPVGGVETWHQSANATVGPLNIKYAGPALRSKTRYWWKVTATVSIGDRLATSTAESEIAAFSIGLLSDDWSGSFIAGPRASVVHSNPWFRRSFLLSAADVSSGSSALLYVASAGYHEVTVNGQAVSTAVLVPSISFLPKRCLYRTYDILPFLREGNNAIGIWASQGWALYFGLDVSPLVLAELHVNDRVRLVTDSQWKWRNSTITPIGGYGSRTRRRRRRPFRRCGRLRARTAPMGQV